MRFRRLRASARWTGAAICAAVLSAWALSGWRHQALSLFDGRHRLYLFLARGQCEVGLVRDPTALPLSWVTSAWPLASMPPGKAFLPRPSWRWGWSAKTITRGAEQTECVTIPLLALFAAAAVPTAVALWREHRRVEPGKCRCGYDLAGLGGAVCPECGRGVVA